MSKSLSVTFRVLAELVESLAHAVSESGIDKTAWLIDTGLLRLSQSDSNPDHRMIALVERMETAAGLIGGKQGIPPASIQSGGCTSSGGRYYKAGS